MKYLDKPCDADGNLTQDGRYDYTYDGGTLDTRPTLRVAARGWRPGRRRVSRENRGQKTGQVRLL